MKISKLNYLIAIVMTLAFALQGCSFTPSYSKIVLEKRIIRVEAFKAVTFESEDVSTKIIDSKTLVINGKVSNSFLIFENKSYEEEKKYYSDGSTYWRASVGYDDRPKYEFKRPWNLSRIQIQFNNKYYDATMSPEGFFEATIILGNGNYFTKPKIKKYRYIKNKPYQLKITAKHAQISAKYTHIVGRFNHGEVTRKHSVNEESIPIYAVYYDVKKAKAFAKEVVSKHEQKCPINLQFKG